MNKTLHIAGALVLAVLSSVSRAETVADAIQACRNEQNDLKRLICFDAVAESMNIYAGAAKSVDEVASERPSQPANIVSSSRQPRGDDFGLESQRLAKETLPSALSAAVASVTESPRGDRIVTLDNGMVWRENDKRSNLRLKEGDAVTIERGVLGAFYLGKENQNSRMSVRRIK
ncbi:hypothetical protein [Aestuariibacter sp. A3R04]|uniref:hypothetical protein n=1 Tax=Aestuariibacter sp. A3R04 TaxID=2841571 RepID=UPI001C0A14EA|nr:hypothetical protein [Aestuariibacter sp. A3R04]MBU3024034.1 hypothetical protein [Aestuariibacter sp. A3R04]